MKYIKILAIATLVTMLSHVALADPADASLNRPITDDHTTSQRLSLKDAMGIALKNNIQLKQAGADVEDMQASVASAKAISNPGVSTTTYVTNSNAANVVTSSPGVNPQNIMVTPNESMADQNVTLMIPLSTGGKIRAGIDSAKSQLASSNYMLEAQKLIVIRDVSIAYHKVLMSNAIVDAAVSRASLEEEQVRITEEKVKTGRMAPLDLSRERAEKADADQALTAAQNDKALALTDLKILMGVDVSVDITLADKFDDILKQGLPELLSKDLNTLVKTAIEARPELKASAQKVAAANHDISTAKSTYRPQIYGIAMADAQRMISSGMNNTGYLVGLSASIPLYDGGERRAATESAIAKLHKAEADKLSVSQIVQRDVVSAYLDYQAAAQSKKAAETGVDAAQTGYDLATLRYNAGKSITAERLDALMALTRAKENLAKANAQLLDARARLIAATAYEE